MNKVKGANVMRGSRLLHVTKCATCGKDATVTIPCPGDSPIGFCLEHLTERHLAASVQDTGIDMDVVFSSLLKTA